jgi:hypothetical protein
MVEEKQTMRGLTECKGGGGVGQLYMGSMEGGPAGAMWWWVRWQSNTDSDVGMKAATADRVMWREQGSLTGVRACGPCFFKEPERTVEFLIYSNIFKLT